ncbi:hypothetical protein [Streptomyces sp.]|uniref:hypothetical protein n=1 Tax=Streptomyces sp. TaxID=1931 RepID=UPI002D79DA82|nr:hypothetical protein [Streptomyces sp.]HET6354270.1 hypothetical protein [Streptomyces sp.]
MSQTFTDRPINSQNTKNTFGRFSCDITALSANLSPDQDKLRMNHTRSGLVARGSVQVLARQASVDLVHGATNRTYG